VKRRDPIPREGNLPTFISGLGETTAGRRGEGCREENAVSEACSLGDPGKSERILEKRKRRGESHFRKPLT